MLVGKFTVFNHAKMEAHWDVIIIGGGHAGCEAAYASSKMGCKTLMITLDPKKIGLMSCNPAIGGLAKGQLVKEIDALGGLMALNTDQTAIQYRKLNSSKGPAVRSSRAQCDKPLYAQKMQEFLAKVEGLTIFEGEVTRLSITKNQIDGLFVMSPGQAHEVFLEARAVVITAGTFMKAVMHTGEKKEEGGRVGDRASFGLSDSLEDLGFRLRRLKTGTPPRLSKKSINFNDLEAQSGDDCPEPFSFYFNSRLSHQKFPILQQVPCYITATNSQVHEIINKNINRSPIFSGAIEGKGPRYCPSIEDKVFRFSQRDRHQIFLEPEGLHVDEIYVNGVSTSLPPEVQEEFIHQIAGLENAVFLRYGYAVEYDSIDARQLKRTFESKDIQGLFMAGQVNGTSGYEEAGGQGILAGINAALCVKEKDPFILGRGEAYIGVLADDLVLKGSDEPYRMFTSRAEYRLSLREDNADLRLSTKAWELGLLDENMYREFCEKRNSIEKGLKDLKNTYFYPESSPNGAETAKWFRKKGLNPLQDRSSAFELLRRTDFKWEDLLGLGLNTGVLARQAVEQLEIQAKYEGYIRRDLELMVGVQNSEGKRIPLDFKYDDVAGLSNEIRGKLKETRPETLGQAARIPGVTPAATANLMIHLKLAK